MGPDLFVFEISEPERSRVEISQDGASWVEVGEADGRAPVDIGPVAEPGARYRFVRNMCQPNFREVPAICDASGYDLLERPVPGVDRPEELRR